MDSGTVWNRLFPPSIHARLFLLTTLLETGVDIAIEAYLLNKFEIKIKDLVTGDTSSSRRSFLPPIPPLPRSLPSLPPETWDRMISLPRALLASTVSNSTTSPPNRPDVGQEAAAAGADTTTAQQRQTDKQVLPVYLLIFVTAHFFQLFLAAEGVWNRNTIQIIGLCMFNAAFLVYAVIQISEIRQFFALTHEDAGEVNVLVDVIPIMIGVCEAIFVFLTYFIYREFGWQIFKKIGADRRIRKMYITYQIFICVLKFDYFFFLGFAVQLVVVVLQQQEGLERPLTIAALPITLVILFLGYLAVRRELRWLMVLFVVTGAVGATYYAYKLVRIYQGKEDAYALVFKSMSVFAGLSFIILAITIIFAVRCWLNFGNGLKEAMDKPPSHSRHGTVRKQPTLPTHKVGASLASSLGFGSKRRPTSDILDPPTSAGLNSIGRGQKIEDGYGYEHKGGAAGYPPTQPGQDARWRESRMSID